MANNFPGSLNDGTSLANARITGEAILASDHNDLADAQIAIETKIGVGTAPATGADAGQVLTADGAGGTTWEDQTGGSTAPTKFVKEVTQTAHGLSVGNVVYFNGTNYVKAKAVLTYAGDRQSDVIGVVSAVASANAFTITLDGIVSGLSGLTAGTIYYLSPTTSGLLASTPPVTDSTVVRPVLYAISATTGELQIGRGRVNAVSRTYSRMGINFGYSQQTDLAAATQDLLYLGRYTNRLRITIPSWNDTSGITNVRALVLLAQSMGFKTSYGVTAAGTGHDATYVDGWLDQVNIEAAWADTNGVDTFYIGNEEDWWTTIGGITGYTTAQIQTMVLAKAAELRGLYPTMRLVYSTAEGEFLAWDAIGNGSDVNWQYLDAFGINMYNADFAGTLEYGLTLGFGSKLFLSEWADEETYVNGGKTASAYRAELLLRRQAIEDSGIDAYFFTFDWGGDYSTTDDWGLYNGDHTYKPGFEQIFSIPR